MNWKHFTFNEFQCNCGCKENETDGSFITKLDELRDELGFPFIITSGYRCPAWNDKVSTTGRTGVHTSGCAADILVDRFNALQVVEAAYRHGFRGFGISQKGEDRFIHLDTFLARPYKTIWSY